MRQLGSEYPTLPTPEGKGEDILENTQNFDSGGDVGAPADFPGRVFPNPQGIKPMLDTEIPPPETERLSGGAKMNTDNAPLTNPKGDVSNPAKTQALPPDPAIAEAGMRESGTHPSQQPQPAQPEPEVKGTDAERKAIEVDKQQAMGTGNLVKLGTALLNERHLSPMKQMKVMDEGGDVTPDAIPDVHELTTKEKLTAPPELNQGYKPMTEAAPKHGIQQATETGQNTKPAEFTRPMPLHGASQVAYPNTPSPSPMAQMQTGTPQEAPAAPAGAMKQMSTATQPQDMYQATAGGALKPGTEPTGQGETPGEQRDLAKTEYKAKLAHYDAERQKALDELTPESKERADRIAYAKQNYIQANPWGSEGNHSGLGGKLLHGLARGTEIAADIAAPGLTQAIPGTPERMAREQAGTQKNMQEDTTLQTARNAEENKADKTAAPIYKEATQGGLIDPKHPELGPQQAYVNQNDPTDIKFSGNMPPPKAPGKDEPLGDRVGNLNQSLTDRYQIRNPGKPLPPEFTLPANATTADYARVDQAMQQNEAGNVNKEQHEATAAEHTATAAEHTATAAHNATEQAGKVYDKYNTQVDKLKTPADAAAARANLAIHNLDLRNKQADSLVAPEILTLAAGGQGSGLRMNDAEISRIIGGRSAWDTLKSMVNKVIQSNGTFDDTQRGQLRSIAGYIAERSAATSSVLDKTRENMLAGQNDEDKVRKAYSDGNRIATSIQRQGIVSEGKVKPGDFIYEDGEVLMVGKDGQPHSAL
jgi:ElaB/YqjD/DUF883 family membrane-anchored ribosome-binding protein